MNWTQWNLIQFLCYSGSIVLISSTLTAWYMLRNQATIRDKEKKLDKSKKFTAYKLKDKPWWHIRFHRPGTIPDDAEKRIYPPLHPGGPVEKDIDTFIISKLEDGMTTKQAWNEAIATSKFYPQSAIDDKVYMKGEFNNMKRRINKGRYSKSRTR